MHKQGPARARAYRWHTSAVHRMHEAQHTLQGQEWLVPKHLPIAGRSRLQHCLQSGSPCCKCRCTRWTLGDVLRGMLRGMLRVVSRNVHASTRGGDAAWHRIDTRLGGLVVRAVRVRLVPRIAGRRAVAGPHGCPAR